MASHVYGSFYDLAIFYGHAVALTRLHVELPLVDYWELPLLGGAACRTAALRTTVFRVAMAY